MRTRLEELEIDEEVHYSQWESVDGTLLKSHLSSVEDFIELLVYSIDNLTTHSFIAKNQAQYLKRRKEELDRSECLILLDFAENYHYVVQDEIQGYHWNKDQCTLHPVVIYYKEGHELKHLSFCIISNDLDHDTLFVHQLQECVAKLIRETLPHVSAGQYKNYKNFLNLCHHKTDFYLDGT